MNDSNSEPELSNIQSHSVNLDWNSKLLENGWKKTVKGDITMKLVDNMDMLYKYPRNIIKGCSCRKRDCTKCSCKARNGCAMKSCRCNCFSESDLQIDGSDSAECDDEESPMDNIPEDFLDLQSDSDSESMAEINEENAEFSSDSDDELPDI